jgi:hypothetical protein
MSGDYYMKKYDKYEITSAIIFTAICITSFIIAIVKYYEIKNGGSLQDDRMFCFSLAIAITTLLGAIANIYRIFKSKN